MFFPIERVYIVMSNGCYGLTKGQDSATADFGSGTRDYNLSVREPWMFGREISGGANIFSSRTNSSDAIAYQLDESGFSIDFASIRRNGVHGPKIRATPRFDD